ncbi:hypothetical protein [Vibrio rotiferianus]|uniref:hypothetical protein n=1 Tax=Vibrio rotiferianus TaxID=190895 RepID=UPI0003A1324A|nr:hypothetical protein [Vibrio rotiferianus]PIB17218.1 hypothetical protein B853_07347 [Vibrio rotiferianus CAIM 577 = LMG 21460]
MPSFITDAQNTVVAVMSFDPVSPEQQPLATYDTSIVGKLFENGAFHDVESLQDDSAVIADDGSHVDE